MALLIKRTLESSKPKDLCLILRKKFSIKLAIDIQQYLLVEPIAPNKIGISFRKDLKLTSWPEGNFKRMPTFYIWRKGSNSCASSQDGNSRRSNSFI